ncbi:hypothetical protein THASP1DRAFT_30134 [Thamnocephalis sphaerospora]|uniref:Uncharacterized protein n=1 Tax=Thamnocephalis sphaerospora TaxID=78915 RepID=A0A4P9XRU2_9FUNG|nr:hypothetical protein THASP1DRAFT_30134 [Thamnocephalis sphaerospora]|eukprot:RKP08050.1 hypothetical protein THASP1DRAFT_30134 [Thamnocephalis sphaerospora]
MVPSAYTFGLFAAALLVMLPQTVTADTFSFDSPSKDGALCIGKETQISYHVENNGGREYQKVWLDLIDFTSQVRRVPLKFKSERPVDESQWKSTHTWTPDSSLTPGSYNIQAKVLFKEPGIVKDNYNIQFMTYDRSVKLENCSA